jgi:cytochrome P450 family 135
VSPTGSLVTRRLRFSRDGSGALPPGPRMPSAVQAVLWAKRPLSFLDQACDRYGDIFTLRIRRRRPWVLLTDPGDVGRVFTTHATATRSGASEANPLLGPLLGPRSVMLLDEPEHMTHRKFMLPSFHGERMHAYGEMMVAVSRRQIATWPQGEPFALWPQMQAISMEVVMRAVFGDAETEHLNRVRALLKRMTDWLNNPRRLALLHFFGPRTLTRNPAFRAVVEPVEACVLEEVRRRRASACARRGEDILSLLEQAHDENGSPMSEQELRDELITLLSDGPTATSLAWAFERLLRHPDKLARLRDEVLAGEGESYAEAVVKETLRLCPTVPVVMRKLAEPMALGRYTVPSGTTVAPCVYLMHRRADIYPDPHRFLPERFLDRPPGTYAWIPFGGGVRRCVAASFAQLEMKRVIQTVLSEVELRAASSRSERAMRSSVSFAPGQHALVAVTRRARVRQQPRAPHLPVGGDPCAPTA